MTASHRLGASISALLLVLATGSVRAAELHATCATLYPSIIAAKPGDVISIAAGKCETLNLYNVNKAAPGITLQPAPGATVEIAGINLNVSDGYTFRAGPGVLEVTPWAHNGIAVAFGGSANHFDGLTVHGGQADYTTAGGNGFMIRDATGGSITNNELYWLNTGINHLNPLNNGETILIARNRLHDIRFDGIRGQSSKIEIRGNTLSDFYPTAGDHPDGVQFWTTGLSAPLHDITIADNVIRQGAGRPIQGLFIGNENRQPFHNLTITGNLVLGGMYHGLSVGWADATLVISDNYVGGFVGNLDGAQQMVPWLMVGDSVGGKVSNNYATGWQIDGANKNTGLVLSNNHTIPLAKAGDYTMANRWLKRATVPFAVSVAGPAAATR